MKYLRYALVLCAAALLAVAFTAPAGAKSSQPLVKVPGSKKAPIKRTIKKSTTATKMAVVLSEPVDLNTATRTELEAVNGIGPVLADRIVKYRRKHGPFTHKGQLVNIKGIGSESYDLLRDQVKVGRRKKMKSR